MALQKRTTSPAFQFYPADFLSDDKVCRMDYEEIGVYSVLLCHAWLAQGLPVELQAIAKMLKMKLAQFKKLWAGTLCECFIEKSGKLVNPRQEKERKKQREFRERQKHAAASRWDKSGTSQKPPSGNALQSSSPISDLQSSDERTRRAPIVARRRMDAAWEGPKGLYVPQRKHSDFIGLRNHLDAERELLAWYSAVAESWVGSPGSDMFVFWTARYNEKWPQAVTAKPDARLPKWAQGVIAARDEP